MREVDGYLPVKVRSEGWVIWFCEFMSVRVKVMEMMLDEFCPHRPPMDEMSMARGDLPAELKRMGWPDKLQR